METLTRPTQAKYLARQARNGVIKLTKQGAKWKEERYLARLCSPGQFSPACDRPIIYQLFGPPVWVTDKEK